MDADGSHQPEQLPLLLAAVEHGADLVLGSRWVSGGEVVNWPLRRKVISRGGSFYSRDHARGACPGHDRWLPRFPSLHP